MFKYSLKRNELKNILRNFNKIYNKEEPLTKIYKNYLN